MSGKGQSKPNQNRRGGGRKDHKPTIKSASGSTDGGDGSKNIVVEVETKDGGRKVREKSTQSKTQNPSVTSRSASTDPDTRREDQRTSPNGAPSGRNQRGGKGYRQSGSRSKNKLPSKQKRDVTAESSNITSSANSAKSKSPAPISEDDKHELLDTTTIKQSLVDCCDGKITQETLVNEVKDIFSRHSHATKVVGKAMAADIYEAWLNGTESQDIAVVNAWVDFFAELLNLCERRLSRPVPLKHLLLSYVEFIERDMLNEGDVEKQHRGILALASLVASKSHVTKVFKRAVESLLKAVIAATTTVTTISAWSVRLSAAVERLATYPGADFNEEALRAVLVSGKAKPDILATCLYVLEVRAAMGAAAPQQHK
eukprot:m.1080635 g.1080635  ORF g.1080635 m.1080635 type:complete len:371 (-) comp24258_c1_seq3:2155-3267(-)